ncbi:MAG: DUF4837 family protein [Candidatus Marinimicrobia bacterium]|nr:DUF4837 family protein [Candidatus Neomarinimicrobiota bacterium]MBT3675599.1 DUF4837 family protein [Candidatus Neomarinimicrobiota bacterium]MBT3763941.1 DUF4837 family protein [Candidatus Neomarinimicrobiota bacterium]MBT4068872.1 DUF4837 family protein [Candidatus Neomarinimicrobiota bacterium]MBT4270034.1 DUF4837 family protein [Candidatus Neomarinimicrobiota bacterium]
MTKRLILCIVTILFWSSCDQFKPRAMGADNELVVVASLGDRDEVQKVLTTIFSDTLFTPQPEPYYHTVWVDPENFTDVNDHVNVIVAAIGDHPRNLGAKLVKQILSASQYKTTMEGDNQLIFAKDVYARNQNYLIMNGPTTEKIIEQAKDQGPWLKKQYDDLFFKRQSKHLFEGSTLQKDLQKELGDKYGWTMKIPWGYTVIADSAEQQFFWMGRDIPYRWLAVQWADGLTFTDSASVHEYVKEIPPKYFGHIEYSDYLFKIEPAVFNERGAWKITGLWESIEEAQGGPFISYLFYDEATDRTYFIHLMIFHPGMDKYMLLRQVDIVAHSFEIVD